MKKLHTDIFPDKKSIPEKFMITMPYDQTEYLLDGEIHTWNGEFETVISPVCFKENDKFINQIGSYPLMDRTTSLKALDAAFKAYDNGNGEWPSMSVENRIECLNKFVLMMKEQRSIVVNLLMWEIGKSLADSEKEFDRTVEYINDTIAALKDADRDASRFTIKQGIIAQIRRAPLGVVLCMGPFNYPLNETFTTLIPSIIMGNTIIFKPPKLGVLLHSPLLNAFCEAFPKGVVNTIYGDGKEIVAPLMESGKLNVLAFIGTSRVADILKKQHPLPHRLRSILGLEAKNPAIILNDTDLDSTVKEVISGALSYNGQRCTALKIIFVQDKIYDSFLEKLSNEVEKLKPGMPWEPEVNITPLPEPGKSEYLNGLIEDAVQKGGHIVNPSGGITEKTLFFPAIISDVVDTMRIYHEEQFGPVIPVVRFTNIEETLEYIEKSNYGQQASIFSTDPVQISILADKLVNQVCRVNINSQCQRGPDIFPFTGRKDSAEGTLSVSDALRVFSIRTLVAIKETDQNKKILNEIMRNKHSSFLSTDFIL